MDYRVSVTCREPLMIQLIVAAFLDFTFLVVVAVAIALAILIVWMNKQRFISICGHITATIEPISFAELQLQSSVDTSSRKAVYLRPLIKFKFRLNSRR